MWTRPETRAPRLARVIAVVALAGFASVYLVAGAPAAVAVFALQLVHVLPALRRLRGPALLAAQAIAGLWGVLGDGASVGMLGFLAGSLLLSPMPYPPLATAVAVAATAIAWLRYGEPPATADAAITTVLIALVIYGLTRLAGRVEQLHAARLALAVAAVTEERLRIAAELSDGLGRGLSGIGAGARIALAEPDRTAEVIGEVLGTARRALADARAAAAEYRAMSLSPELATARAMLSSAGVAARVRARHDEPLGPAGALLAAVLRATVTEVVRRATATSCAVETESEPDGTVRLLIVHDGTRTAEDESLGDLPRRVAEAGGTLTTGLSPEGRHTVTVTLPGPGPAAPPTREDPRSSALAFALLAAVLVGFSAKALLQLPPPLLPPAAACLALIVFMQLRSVSGRHMRSLALMAVLTYVPILFFGGVWLGVAGFLAGPVLLAFPQAVAWPLAGLVTGSVAVVAVVLGTPPGTAVNLTVSTVVTGLVMYGLLRLAQLAKELQEAQQELARAAVVEERLRAARDLHDLLGHSMAAILLKCELARRLPQERARAEIEDVLAMVERAEIDMRSVSGERHEMSLTAEAESARSVLAAAGIEVRVELGHDPVPAEAETVLSAVLREAVTNVLRHSAARRCLITTASEDGETRLRVSNDGARGGEGRRGSAGIGNLTTRLAVLDGSLAVARAGDRYELEARVPADVPA
ncbi:histidine kinase [Nonomuraea pusilla]|uniref:sensor histidine kinase n=1 Tax=Nonomuraea pusilla TaxID=46177 RepID=UPI0033248A31